ncbi:MAG TPA: M28 family peptidase [Pyrinomonadaceae bacterium]|nr:M28 family peptidase [Pyrinomonadaceae bacterium]
MKKLFVMCWCVLACARVAPAQAGPTLLPRPAVAHLAEELSGETAKRNLEFVAREHRMRGSRGFRAAAEFVAARLREYGLSDVRVERFPADGKIFYGTQRARPAWDAEFAELWEVSESAAGVVPVTRVASWEAMPVSLAQDSESAQVTAALVDVGSGTSESDYAGRDVRGRLVLASSQPGPVARLAVERFGAAGVLSYAQNQRTAWWGEDENLVRWGHLDSFATRPTFAFMLSLKQARAFQSRLARGEKVTLRADVRAGRHAGFYEVVTAVIPGADPALRGEEVAYSCHLDHQRPGANDNASGSVTILEVARTLAKLIREKKLAPPRRTLRFIWPPEIEGTLAYLNARPEVARRLKAVIHMDMVGGGPATKAVFHVTRGPASLPSFVNDVAEEFGAFANEQSARFAKGQPAEFPLHSPEGGREALQAEFAEFTMGSDHQVYADSSFRVPAVYLNDWPDRYIHTNFDTPANVDPTKLKRAGFVGAATGYHLANLTTSDLPSLMQLIRAAGLRRAAVVMKRRAELAGHEADNLVRFHFWHERELVNQLGRFLGEPDHAAFETARDFLARRESLFGDVGRPAPPAGDGALVFRRNTQLKGPMSAFGYDYFTAHYGEERAAKLRLLNFRGARGSGDEYAYEVLNFADGTRTAQEIRDAVSAVYGPVPLEAVVEYLRALESIKVVGAK